MKPENKESTPPNIDMESKGMSLPEHYQSRRPVFLATAYNLDVARQKRKRAKLIWYLLLAISMVIVLVWAVTR